MRLSQVRLVFSLTLLLCLSLDAYAEKVVIVGGGIAGLTALHQLKKAGVDATLYESQSRVGGRILTVQDGFGMGFTLNGGAELLDSTHTKIIKLAEELDVPIRSRWRGGIEPERLYFFDGEVVKETEFMKEMFQRNGTSLRQYAQHAKIIDQHREGKTVFSAMGHLSEFAQKVDRLTAQQYLQSLGCDQSLINYFHAGVTSEMGRGLNEVSALVLFESFEVDTEKSFIRFLPDNDETIVIEGGTQKLTDKLANLYSDSVHTNSKLVSIEKNKAGKVILTFEEFLDGAKSFKNVLADEVIITIAPPDLTDLNWKMTPPKQILSRDIQGAGNSKLALLFKQKRWGDQPAMGLTKGGVGFQLWNVPNSKGSEHGILMFYSEPLTTRGHDPKAVIDSLLSELEKAYPGIRNDYLGFDHHEWPFSYAQPDRPGDRTFRRIHRYGRGPVHWAGEAFSSGDQGYMNGAIHTAEQAVSSVLKRLERKSKKKSCANLMLASAAQ